jgi:uncharacterized membrane protein
VRSARAAGWVKASRGLPAALVLAAAAAVALSVASIFRHQHFGSNAYDLGIFDQTIWGYSRFELVPSTVMRLPNPMAFHFHPIIMSLAPLYWVWEDPRVLLAAQAGLIAVSSVPLFLYARSQLGTTAALFLQVAFLVFWGVIGASLFDFHEVAFAAPILSLALYALLTKRTKLLVAAAMLGLLTREDLALTIAAIGVYVALSQTRWRLGGAIAAASLAWFFVTVDVLVPALSNGAYPWQYRGLGDDPGDAAAFVVTNPLETLEQFFTPRAKRIALFNLLAPWLFLPLASPVALLALPTLAARFLSDNPSLWAPQGFHYSLVLTPFLAFATVDALDRLSRLAERRRQAAVLAAAAGLLATGLYFSFVRLRPLAELERYATATQIGGIRRCLTQVPADVSVAATSALVPHLSERHRIYVLDERTLPQTQYYVVDTATWTYPLTVADLAELVGSRLADGYGVRCSEATVVVLARGASGRRLDPRLEQTFRRAEAAEGP